MFIILFFVVETIKQDHCTLFLPQPCEIARVVRFGKAVLMFLTDVYYCLAICKAVGELSCERLVKS